MAYKKGEGGRQKGVRNKVTTAVKEVIAGVAQDLGGRERLAAWVKEDKQNERIFWGSIYPKMLPLDITASEGLTINVNKRIDAGQ